MMKKLLRAAFALAAGGATADVVDFADPMVGTAGTGHCSPAAAFPFGMVQPGADTGRAGWNYCAGYFYPDTTLVGFSQTHLNGTGSTDLGDLSIFPFTGERPAKFESRFSHECETASPGFYAVTLDDFGVRAEATCSKRIAYYRFTAGGPIRLFVDPTSVINGGENDLQTRVVKSELKVESDSRLTGFVAKKGWISRKLWYVVEADRPLVFEDGVWSGTDKELKVRIALSAASLEGAKRNLASDRGTWDFDRIRAEARTAWRGCLGRVAIPEGTCGTVKRNLVTALYRLCLQPNLLSDAGEPPVYSTFSLWDTYRAAHPLYCELFPEMVPDFVNSLLEQGRRTGYLPVWPLWGQETDWMIGTHSIPVIADAFLRGIPDVDWGAAYAQVRDTLMKRHGRAKIDWGLLDRYGYYPCDIVKSEGVSRLLEDTFDCWCAGKMAERLGHTDDAALFFRRANAWTNVYDRATGFVRGRRSDGGWRTPFDPREVGHNVDTDNDFTEGNAWQWTWHVLQDPEGLIAAMGGKEKAVERLDALFSADSVLAGEGAKVDVTGLIGQYAHGNEPSHHIPWLYTLCGRPDKTKAIVGEIMDKFYRPSPDGLCGNDDCGQMSAWYVWAFLGRYPVTPCGEEPVKYR